MRAASKRLSAIVGAQKVLADEREKLELFNRMRETGIWPIDRQWKPRLTLRSENRYGLPAIEIEVKLPWQIVQQQLVYAVAAAEREVIKLGGVP